MLRAGEQQRASREEAALQKAWSHTTPKGPGTFSFRLRSHGAQRSERSQGPTSLSPWAFPLGTKVAGLSQAAVLVQLCPCNCSLGLPALRQVTPLKQPQGPILKAKRRPPAPQANGLLPLPLAVLLWRDTVPLRQ